MNFPTHDTKGAKVNAEQNGKAPSAKTGLGRMVAMLASLFHRPGRGMPAVLGAVGILLIVAPSAGASFGLHDFDLTFDNADGTPATQAGSHPFAVTNSFEIDYTEEAGEAFPDGRFRDAILGQIAGLVGDTTAYPRCSTLDFSTHEGIGDNKCPLDTAVGVNISAITTPGGWVGSAVYNLTPPPGVLLRLGFRVGIEDIIVDIRLKHEQPYNAIATALNIPETVYVFGNKTQLWGNPSDPAHDSLRGGCYSQIVNLSPGEKPEFESETGETCPVAPRPKPFLTLPTRCTGQNLTSYAVDSFENPGAFREGEPDLTDPNWLTGSVETHDAEGNPQPFTGCGKLGFNPSIVAKPTTKAAQSPTGLDFSLDVKDEGLTSVAGLANSDIKKAVVTLPKEMSINPSIAEGLEVCTKADLAGETLSAAPGEGCPEASKIGTIEVESPLVQEPIKGSLFQAQQDNPATAEPGAENPFDSLVAFYFVIKNPKLGVIVKQPVKVEPDPVTGQLTTVADNIPQLPFSHFRLHFREGARSPLASPPACGSYDVKAELTPWSGGAPITTTSAFQIVSGPDNSPCPAGGTPPFHPGLTAGTINNAAGRYSPFNLRLFRNDGEQEITHFSIKLPPGLVGKLAGIPYCSDAAIAAAEAREHPGGGTLELQAPSCPAASEVGRTLAGSGVGSSLAYAPGKIYLAGSYNGSALSIAAITAAKVGPFDLGTVVVRQALKINPETAEVFIDATGSDPIPHIIQGIPVHLRDIRAYVDKPEFVLNPTSCKRTSTASTVLGSGLNFGSEADDVPITVTSPFQAADCASLGFAPKLALSLKGGTKRGATPKFKAVLTYPKGAYANIAAAQVTLPHSVFLEQAHIKTICTRVQFAAGKVPGEMCPAGSVYGSAKAVTPILSDPLEGPVYLRSSSHNLPDLVVALHNGQIDVNVVGRIDSVKGGRIRNTFESVPDAPVSSFTLEMQGGKKGLLVNSTNLCKSTNRAIAHFTGQNGKVHDFKPVLAPSCKQAKRQKRHARAKG
jgi:hypothetical protein